MRTVLVAVLIIVAILGVLNYVYMGGKPAPAPEVPVAKAPEPPKAPLPPIELPPKPKEPRAAWRYKALIDPYVEYGRRNPQADVDVVQALALYAQSTPTLSTSPTDDEVMDAVYAAMRKGSNDPHLRYLYLTMMAGVEHRSPPNYFDFMESAIEEMIDVKVHPLFLAHAMFKFAGELHTAKMDEQFHAVPIDITRKCQSQIDKAMLLMPGILADKTIPRGELYGLFRACADASAAVKQDRKVLFDTLVAEVSKVYPNSAMVENMTGSFYVNYAWDARGGGFANTVTDAKMKLFSERLALAEKSLQNGWKLDPTDAASARHMLTVVKGTTGDDTAAQSWFTRAVTAEPGNYFTYHQRTDMLLPRWGGTRDRVLLLGRTCLNKAQTETNSYGHLARVLIEGHSSLAQEWDWQGPEHGYWLQRDVWPDLESAYAVLLKLRPNSRKLHTECAYHAWRCRNWRVAQEQFKWLDGKPVFSVFNGEKAYEAAIKDVTGKLLGAY